jgi:ketosteroid isomerase-like protein
MSQANVEMCRRAYEAFNRGDSEGMVADLAEEFEFVPTGALPVGAGFVRNQSGLETNVLIGDHSTPRRRRRPRSAIACEAHG